MADDDKKNNADEKLKTLETTVTQLVDSQKKLLETFDGVSDSLLAINTRLDVKEPEKKPDAKGGPSSRDLEQMNRGDYTTYLLDEVDKLISNTVKPVEDRLEGESNTRKRQDVAGQIAAAEESHKDFWDWKSEMGEVAKNHPTLSVKQIYKMARDGNSEKATELDEKYNPKESDEEKNKKKEAEFGGLFPNSGNLSSEELKKDMTSEEAVELAWDKTMKGVQIPSE